MRGPQALILPKLPPATVPNSPALLCDASGLQPTAASNYAYAHAGLNLLATAAAPHLPPQRTQAAQQAPSTDACLRMAHPRRAKANYVVNSACDTASTDEGYARQHSLPPVTIPSSTTQHSQCLLAGSKHAQGTEQHTHCCADRWRAACCARACAVQVRLRHDSRGRRGHSHLRATGTRRIPTAAVPPRRQGVLC